MQRFFVEPSQIDEGAHQIHITGSDVKHIVNVLRMKTGEELWISDGDKKNTTVPLKPLMQKRSAFIFFILRSRTMSFQIRFICFRVFQRQIRWS